ncbi:uncharacterized protein LOC132278346 [Cornus florida]|uniref:uncharacterized protein LOC132278346 n=1 Tax=Cornus florida TaxID=4283 RepID=UPI00289C74DD|nr:uncharacterized protein LOC132278346 [Cornus florida]
MIPDTSTGDFEKHVNVVHNGKSEVKINIETKDHEGFHKKYLDYEDFGKRVITIAGENRGAIMELSPSRKKHDIVGNPNGLHKKGGNPTASISECEKSERESNEEGKSALKTTFMNSNVQGVNDSILYNSFFTHHDPGVRLCVFGKANGGGHGAQLND